jgi:hypothetical protein
MPVGSVSPSAKSRVPEEFAGAARPNVSTRYTAAATGAGAVAEGRDGALEVRAVEVRAVEAGGGEAGAGDVGVVVGVAPVVVRRGVAVVADVRAALVPESSAVEVVVVPVALVEAPPLPTAMYSRPFASKISEPPIAPPPTGRPVTIGFGCCPIASRTTRASVGVVT